MTKKLKAYTLFSSSKGNCTYIEYGSDSLLIDAGASAKQIALSLSALGTELKSINGIFVSHEHIDHTKGLQVISKAHGIPIYTDPLCMQCIGIGSPAAYDMLTPAVAGDTVYIGDIKVELFPTPHDSIRSVCYRVTAGTDVLGYATDIGHISDEVQDAVFGCDYAVIESNYDEEMLTAGPYSDMLKRRISGGRGHLSNTLCACLAPVLTRCGAKSLVLAHLSETNNTPQAAYNATHDKLTEYGVSVAGEAFAADVKLSVAAVKGITQITM